MFLFQVLVPSQHRFCLVCRSWRRFRTTWKEKRHFFRILNDSWQALRAPLRSMKTQTQNTFMNRNNVIEMYTICTCTLVTVYFKHSSLRQVFIFLTLLPIPLFSSNIGIDSSSSSMSWRWRRNRFCWPSCSRAPSTSSKKSWRGCARLLVSN